MAYQQRQPPSGLVHHSDRGSQYGRVVITTAEFAPMLP